MEMNRIILISAKPGHFRDSLVAVLKTLPRSNLFLLEELESAEFADSKCNPAGLSFLLLADLDVPSTGVARDLDWVKVTYPNICCIAMTDNFQQTKTARNMGADVVLPRSASAGELLAIIQQVGRGLHTPAYLPRTSAILSP